MKSAALALALIGTAVPIAAHHSFDGSFDRTRQVKLSGTVAEYRFANPHSYLKLAVVTGKGAREQWHVETTSAGSLGTHGWDAHSIRAGEGLTVEGWPARNGGRYMRLRSMHRPDGRAVGLWLPPGP